MTSTTTRGFRERAWPRRTWPKASWPTPTWPFATGRSRAWRHACHCNHSDQAADRGARLRCHQRRRRRDFFRLARGHIVRVRLSRRRSPSLRPQDIRRGFHPGVPGAADRTGHERPHHPVVLLARAAAGRARHGVAVGAHARRRRRGRAVNRSKHLSRHGRGAAVHPPLSGTAYAQRIVSGDDRRHGRHRRHRAGALRYLPRAVDTGRGGAFCHCLRAGCPGGYPGQPDHGAGDFGQAHRRIIERSPGRSRSRHACLLHDGRHRQGHHGGT